MEWAEETIIRLRDLWSEGHSTAEIGRRLGVSKNAVVGKAHRLDLPARPSPIRRDGPSQAQPRRTAPRRMAGPTLPPLTSAAPPPSASSPADAVLTTVVARAPASGPEARTAPKPAPIVVPRAHAAPPRPYGRIVTCCWPIGEPGTRTFRFCDAESVPGKPYCSPHAQLAYVKVRDRREDAA